MTEDGERLGWVRIDNDPVALGLELAKAGPDPEVVLEATYGWYWAVDVLQAAGAEVHLAHPWGVKGSPTGGARKTSAAPPIWPARCGGGGGRGPLSGRRRAARGGGRGGGGASRGGGA